MSPEAQRIAIAEACGWTDFKVQTYSDDGTQEIAARRVDKPHGPWPWLPRYLSDLNAIRGAILTLGDPQRGHFWDALHELVIGHDFECRDTSPTDCLRTMNATASQQAEVLLKVLGKWDDSK